MEQLSGYRIVGAVRARSLIACLALDDVGNEISRLGEIALRPHQVSAVTRLRSAIEEFGGALLCDPVGTGKTYIALGLIPDGARTLVVAPAILRRMWERASLLAGRDVEFASFESLSRGKAPGRSYDFVIVDEAHHARNVLTKRYRILSQSVSGADMVLLSATPVHNESADLRSMLALFLGKRADVLSAAEFSRCVIRRSDPIASLAGIPETGALEWFRIAEDSRMPALLLSLPPPVPPRDGGDGGVLVAHSLIRQWASSDAALLGAVRRRLVRAESLSAALADGTWPSRSELSSWIAGEDAVQLGFSSLLSDPADGTAALALNIRAHARGLRLIRDRIRFSSADRARVDLIRRIRSAHPATSIVAFSQYADTVNALFAKVSCDGKVAVLTGSGARVAGGRISRDEVIERFAPVASGRPAPPRSEMITLLLATDLLSEGLNLQDAGVVIHLDLPWTPARMEQRLGRIARVGSRHSRVRSYAIHPPVSADDVTRIEEILRRKIGAAGIAIAEFPSLKGWSPAEAPRGEPALAEEIRGRLRRWSTGLRSSRADRVASAVTSTKTGFLAAVVDGERVRLLASLEQVVSDEPRAIFDTMQLCESGDAPLAEAELAHAESEIHSFLDAETALLTTRVSSAAAARSRNAAMRRVNRAVERARPHDRSQAAAKAEGARRMLMGNLNAHQEMELERLCSSETDDEMWVDQVLAIRAAEKAKWGSPSRRRRIHAIILLKQ